MSNEREILEYPSYHGRKIIYTPIKKVTRDNVCDVLSSAFSIHQFNSSQIMFLYNYYRGIQPIKDREKEVRPEIQNNIVENTAYEIVSFKSSYLLGEPCTYTRRGNREEENTDIDALQELNDYMFILDKSNKDKMLSDWLHICGIGFRMVLPTNDEDFEQDSPFQMEVLHPAYTFCVYNSGYGHRKLMGVTYTRDENDSIVFTVYTPDAVYKVVNGVLREPPKPNPLGMIPIIEYRANTPLLGAFEPVLPLLDALNTLQSNRVDDVEQIVQAFLKFTNCEVNDEIITFMQENKVLMLPKDADCNYVTAPLDQQQTQTLVDYTYSRILTICGMPATQNGGASTSDTGQAVMLRDGWRQAEANASDTEGFFKSAEKEMLKLVIKILRDTVGTSLSREDIEIKFTRRQYEASLQKAEVLNLMLQLGISPKVAFPRSGLFYDPADALEQSKELIEKKWGINSVEEGNQMSELQQETSGSREGQGNTDNQVSEM
jgi:SPP1 family phage portal protein